MVTQVKEQPDSVEPSLLHTRRNRVRRKGETRPRPNGPLAGYPGEKKELIQLTFPFYAYLKHLIAEANRVPAHKAYMLSAQTIDTQDIDRSPCPSPHCEP